MLYYFYDINNKEVKNSSRKANWFSKIKVGYSKELEDASLKIVKLLKEVNSRKIIIANCPTGIKISIAGLIAEKVAMKLGCGRLIAKPVNYQSKKFYSQMSRQERIKVFRKVKNMFIGKVKQNDSIVLIDDCMVTGAALMRSIRSLKDKFPNKEILSIVLVRLSSPTTEELLNNNAFKIITNGNQSKFIPAAPLARFLLSANSKIRKKFIHKQNSKIRKEIMSLFNEYNKSPSILRVKEPF